MRSASPIAGPSSSSAAPSSSAAGPSNPGPKTPVGQAARRCYLTTPTVVHCHNYMVRNAPVHMSTFAGGRNLQSSFGMNVASGRGIDGNGGEIDDHQGGIDSNEWEEEVELGRQVQRQRQGPKRKRTGKGNLSKSRLSFFCCPFLSSCVFLPRLPLMSCSFAFHWNNGRVAPDICICFLSILCLLPWKVH